MIAYQGEPGSFSEWAAKKFFGSEAVLVPQPNFADVFKYVEEYHNRHGIVPIENSLFGSIHQVYDLLLKHKVFIIGELKLRIELHLMALPGTKLRNVKVIYSQLQAINQCENFLNQLKDVQVETVHDTAAAARYVRENSRHNAAAIASEKAAKTHGLKILKRNIESDHRNYTRFIALSKKMERPAGKAKTSVVFIAKDIPGALFRALSVFALRDINLMKIESRPIVGKPWEYMFYLDVVGIDNKEPLLNALKHLKELSAFVRVLGCYPPYESGIYRKGS